MTIRQLASELAKREGKRSQAHIGDIRELLGHLADMMVGDPCISITSILWPVGEARAKRKRKK